MGHEFGKSPAMGFHHARDGDVWAWHGTYRVGNVAHNEREVVGVYWAINPIHVWRGVLASAKTR